MCFNKLFVYLVVQAPLDIDIEHRRLTLLDKYLQREAKSMQTQYNNTEMANNNNKCWFRVDIPNEKSPSSSLPIILYRSKPLKLRCHPRPKSSFVHWSVPCLPITRHGNVTRDPTIAVWSCGSMAKRCPCLSDMPSFMSFGWPSTIDNVWISSSSTTTTNHRCMYAICLTRFMRGCNILHTMYAIAYGT